ncbi:MAG: DUF7544 domain-containing protein [Anaerolineae bacterium]
MQHFDILRRAWEKTWRYRALWIFGLLVALTAGGGGSGGGGWSGGRHPGGPPQFFRGGGFDLPEPLVGFLVAFVGVLLILFILFAVVFALLGTVARYVGDSALMQLVDREEAEGTRPTLAAGFRLGWSSATLRLFVVDLVVGVPVVVMALVLILLAGAPLLLWLTRDVATGVTGTVLAVLLFVLVVLFLLFIGMVVGLFRPFYQRRSVLGGRGAFAAIGEGVTLVIRHFGDVLLMWLIMFFVNLFAQLLLVILALLLVLVVLLIFGLPALGMGWMLSALFDTYVGYGLAFLGTIPWIFTLVLLPSLLARAIFETFKSTVWTLTYRELVGREQALQEG